MVIWKSKGQVIAVDPPLVDMDRKDLDKEYKKLREKYINKLRHLEKKYSDLRGRMILSDPEGVFETKEAREKRWEAEKLKAKRFRKKIRRYLYAVLILIGLIIVFKIF